MSNKEGDKVPSDGTTANPIKITLLGGGGIGKSCVTIRFLSKTFENDVKLTILKT
jgi:GTPase SAR1 family protein